MNAERLRELYGNAGERAAAKVIDRLDDHCKAFIAQAPFIVLATSNGTGLDTSPKGDAAGFVQVLDDSTLLIPDRPGNNRIDGLVNILANPQVAILFVIPTVGETLRVNGVATISEDSELCGRFLVNGRAPKTVTTVQVQEVFMHCGKAFMRSGLWKPETWPKTRPVASLGDVIHAHTGGMDVPYKTEADVVKEYKDTLY
jgi:uncharacterized protein